MYDKTNEERESRLDVLLDRLRQENSAESLENCQNLCLHLLSEIKGSYYEFCDEQTEKVEVLLLLAGEELDRYGQSVCSFFNLSKSPQTSESKTTSPEDDDDDTEVDKITTPAGIVYYVTGDDVTQTNDSSEDDDDDVIHEENFTPESENSSLAEHLVGVMVSGETVKDLMKKIRFSFLQHLDGLKENSLQTSQEKVDYKKEELKCELELRLHLHVPRKERIRKDIRNVREAELGTHEDRIDRHCKGVQSAMESFKSTLHNFAEFGKQQVKLYKTHTTSIEEKISKLNQQVKIEEKIEEANDVEDQFVDTIKKEAKLTQERVNKKLESLKKSNKLCLSSFKLFADGGNFSPDEVAHLTKSVEAEIKSVETFELSYHNSFDDGVDKVCEQIHEYKNKFAERMKFHIADVKFVETLQRWFLNAQVNIKSEVTKSNMMTSQLQDDLALLIGRIDACEYSHVDKEKVTVCDLWKFSVEVIDRINIRCRSLDCLIPPPVEDDVGGQADEDNKVDATATETEKDQSVITVIKNIYKKQSTSENTQPSSAMPIRKIYREERKKSLAPETKGKKASAQPSAKERRDSKMDSKLFPFGSERPQQEHFLAKISATLFDVLENLYTICDQYYKHKGFRPATRPNYIQDNYDNCCEHVLEKTLRYYDQCQKHYDYSLSELRDLLEKFEIVFQDVPRLVIKEFEDKFSEEFDNKLQKVEESFQTDHDLYRQQKQDNKIQMVPRLGHPQMRQQFLELQEKEKERKAKHQSLIEETFEKSKQLIEDSSIEFIEKLTSVSTILLENFQDLNCIDDVIIPETTPEVKICLETMLKKRVKLGVELDKITISNPSGKISDLKRGTNKWESLEIPSEISLLHPDKQFGGEIETTNTVKPQQQTIQSRDKVFKNFIKSRDNALKVIALKRGERLDTERRWNDHWEKSMKKINDFYN